MLRVERTFKSSRGYDIDILAGVGRSIAVGYLLLLVLLPLEKVIEQAFMEGWTGLWQALTYPAAVSAIALSIKMALLAAAINTVTGTFLAFVLVRYALPGKAMLNALVDLPFAVPTAVSGILMLVLYGPRSPAGGWFTAHGLEVLYAQPGIVLAMIFVTFPFTIRAVQPLLMAMDTKMEEAAKTLGASRWQTLRWVILPSILPGIMSGFSLAFSRSLAEFGAVIVVAGNVPLRTQVASVFIYGQVESNNLTSAAAVSMLLLGAALLLLVAQNKFSSIKPGSATVHENMEGSR